MLAGKTVNSFLRNLVSNCCCLRIHLIPSYWMEFQNIFSVFLGFHWIPIDWWKYVKPIEYKVYTELIKVAYFFNKRQRNKDNITARRKGKNFLWLMSGNKLNSFLKDWFSNCSWLGRHSIPSYWMELKRISKSI